MTIDDIKALACAEIDRRGEEAVADSAGHPRPPGARVSGGAYVPRHRRQAGVAGRPCREGHRADGFKGCAGHGQGGPDSGGHGRARLADRARPPERRRSHGRGPRVRSPLPDRLDDRGGHRSAGPRRHAGPLGARCPACCALRGVHRDRVPGRAAQGWRHRVPGRQAGVHPAGQAGRCGHGDDDPHHCGSAKREVRGGRH